MNRLVLKCGSGDAVEHVADLAPGQPWLVCRRCLDQFAEDALLAELRRQRVPKTTINAVIEKVRALRSDEHL